MTMRYVYTIENESDMEDWRLGQERATSWKPEMKEDVAPLDLPGKSTLEETVQMIHEKAAEKRALVNERITAGPKMPPFETFMENARLKEIKDHINPAHYQDFVDDYQWIEVMEKIYADRPEAMNGFLEITSRKYMDRLGGKDPELQEMKKSLWYKKLLVARQIRGNEYVEVKDVDNILKNG
jgi:hypothetical protein